MVVQPAAAMKQNTAMAGDATKSSKTATTIVNGPESPYKPSKVLLSSVNPYITCNLCKGYLIDATTIVECLHSFCHSCIMKHLRTEQYCPQCEMMINKAKPNIKPDATLQSIVYKLVPGLYEKELLRKRAFYRQHPEKAALTTPEQRGEDTEHLIFSPSDMFSLTLEYADKELAEDNEELLKPKILKCPAVFTIAYLKKFIVYKYNIPTHLFYVEIMYKVQTITLPDHYTLMDVAYIYTWKKDAHMRFFYRIRTHEMKSVELPEVPLRRSPSISTGRSSTSLTTIKEEEDSDSKDNLDLIKPSDIKQEEPSMVECDNKVNSDTETSIPASTVVTMAGKTSTTLSTETVATSTCATVRSGVSEPSLDVKSHASLLGAKHPQPQLVESVEHPKVKKNESIKLKIEMNKNTYVSILQSPQPDAGTKHHKSDKAEKVKKKKSEEKDKSVNKIKSSSDLKIKIEKVKDGLVSVKKDGKSSKKVPYKVELTGLSDMKNNNHKSVDNEYESKKAKKEAKMLDKSAKKVKSPKRNPDLEKVQPSIVLKIDQKSPELSTSTLKMVPLPLASSSPKQKSEITLEDEKSQFLNSFELTPIKSVQSKSGSPVSSPGSGSCSPPSSTSADAKQGKRKNKDAPAGRSVLKKPKLSDDEMKAIVERTVQQTKSSTSEHLASLSMPVKTVKKQPEIPSIGTPAPLTPLSQPVKSEPLSADGQKLEQKSKTTGFKSPLVTLPPPVVSTNNIPAPKPAQPVMIAPKPVAETARRPTVPSFPKPIQPMKKLPPLLPKDLDYMKNNKQKLMEMKRPQQTSTVNLNISPNKETEISQIKPEDAKKNIKVYGPPSDNDNFAIPAAIPSLPKPKTNKNRPVNFLNYALHNANKAPAGSRTPIPSYSNSPSYSPDSPQYNPNFNISTKQYKYTNPLAYANFVQNMLNDRKSSNVSPPSVPEKKLDQTNERKRPCPSPEIKQEPPEKQPKVQSLLNQINIPSSLSITLATEEDEAAREKARKSLPEEDKNYIEILKLPEISITEAERTTPPKALETSQKKSSKSSSPTKSDSLKGQKANELDKSSFQDSFIQSIKGKVEKQQRPNKSGNKPEKQLASVFTPPTSIPNNNAFKLPNATVLSNGIVKLNSYPELDLINKQSASQSPRPLPSPPKTTTSKHIPIAPKPTGTFFPPTGTPPMPSPAHRKSMSPPVPKPSVSPIQPKSKTPPIVSSSSPSHAALASMGPMFGLQMKPEGSGYHQKKSEPRPKKSAQKSPKSAALDLTATNPPMVDKTKETMNLLMNNNISSAQKYQMASYLNGMMVPMSGNPIINQMMAASFYLQQWNRMNQANADSLEK